jgi:hypothetical protein
MHFLTSLIMIFGFAFIVCLGLVKMVWDLSQVSAHESPAILETPGKHAIAEEPPANAIDAYESSATD